MYTGYALPYIHVCENTCDLYVYDMHEFYFKKIHYFKSNTKLNVVLTFYPCLKHAL